MTTCEDVCHDERIGWAVALLWLIITWPCFGENTTIWRYTRMYPHYIDERKGNQKTLTRSSCKKTLGLATARPRNSAFPTWGLTMFLASNIPIFLASYQLPSSVLSEDISQSSSSAPQDWFEITLSWSHTSITVMGGDILISSLTMEVNIVNMEPKSNLLKGVRMVFVYE